MARIIYTDMAGKEQTISIDYNSPIVTIGRAVDCNIRSNRKSVSRHHAEFKFSNNQVQVQDLNSSNGTFIIINDQRRAIMGTQMVNDNDEIWCGDFVLRYEAFGDTVSAPSERSMPIPTFSNSPDLAFSATQPPGLDRASDVQPKKLGLGLANPTSDPLTNPFGSPPSPPGLLEQSGFDPLSEDIAELERLMAEKSSIEDLATRQAQEIDRLEDLLEGAKRESTKSVDDLRETKHEIDEKEEEIQRLQRELGNQNKNDTVADLEEEVLSLRALNAELRQQDNSDENEALHHQLIQKDAEIEELGETNLNLGQINDKLTGEIEETKLTVESLNSLLADLNHKVLSQENDSEKEEEIALLKTRLTKIKQDKKALELLNTSLEKNNAKDKKKFLKEITALKEKQIFLEKEKAALQLQSKNASEQQGNNQNITTSKKELLTFLTKLERIVDAIQRADLSPLSTVDRVRLQSAIRESKPKSTLRSFIENNSE